MKYSETNLTVLDKRISILQAKLRKAKIHCYRCRYERQLQELMSERDQIIAENLSLKSPNHDFQTIPKNRVGSLFAF